MLLLEFPTDVLADIISFCDTRIIETCQELAAVAYSTPSLWSTISLGLPQCGSPDGPEFLRAQLRRTGSRPLYVSIGPVSVVTTVHSKLCTILAEDNSRVRSLELTALTPELAATLLTGIFPATSAPSVAIFSELRVLSIQLQPELVESRDVYPPGGTLLDATEIFPELRCLRLLGFSRSIPVLYRSSFRHLHTLILGGTAMDDAEILSNAGAVVALLHCTPQLECLWMKDLTFEYLIDERHYCDVEISTHIRLPHLTSLAVSVPGLAADLVYCIDAPKLCRLHLDGTYVGCLFDEDDFIWDLSCIRRLMRSLKKFASRCRTIRYLATTATFLTREDWEWVLFGDGNGPPFPELESISVHHQSKTTGSITFGLDDDLLLRFSREPCLPLRRFVLLANDFPLSGSAVIDTFKSIMKASPNRKYELIYDVDVPHFKDREERENLKALGVDVDCCWVDWWEYSPDMIGTDWFVY
ncbi:hypothetical protein AX15_003260 [Amanita polypyramis BW_CC]|nr:hypothetical protein AX15_003260 [Amanita polypyramis BW_CC]